MMNKTRCDWVTDDPLYRRYHDEEWGIPFARLKQSVHTDEDHYLFEMLSLEGAQAGLSWLTILKRREGYRKAFDYFHPSIISQYNEDKVQQLLQNKNIIRNELKIRSVITNAKAFLAIQEEFGSFHQYIWQFVGGKPILNDWKTYKDVPSATKESTDMSKDLKKRGFKFVGPTICYAFMQAVGMVNDHLKTCFLYHRKMHA